MAITGGMITTNTDGTATVDLVCYKDDEDGGISADLCETAAQSIKGTVGEKVERTFVITATGVSPGDVLDFRLTVAITDAATGTAVLGEISRIELQFDIKG